MEIIKRDKTKVEYDQNKIVEAIKLANADIRRKDRIKVSEIREIADEITNDLQELSKSASVEDIQDKVEKKLIERGHAPIAKQYIRYRYRKELLRQSNTTDNSIRELLEGESDYWSKENSNKNAKLVTTQRDYIAGIVSKDISKRFIIPKEVLDAHDKGIIHIHDTDYLAQNTLHNCCLVNLEDMLQNGTVINNVMIERPHRFLTAATIASQIITAVSSSQYGGTSISLSHLAPFVNDSRKKFRKKYENINLTEEQINELTEIDVKKEIEDGIQTFIYQVNSMSRCKLVAHVKLRELC